MFICNLIMYVAFLSFFFVCGIWIVHYEFPKHLKEDHYIISGMASGYNENNSKIPGGEWIQFKGIPEYLNTSCFISKQNNTYHVGYFLDKCSYNEMYTEKLNEQIIIEIIINWSLTMLILCACIWELARKEEDFNSTTKYKSFMCGLVFCWMIFVLVMNIFDVLALHNTKTQNEYIAKHQYSISGRFVNTTRFWDQFTNQYELLDLVCGLHRYAGQESMFIQFDTCQLMNTYNSYQKKDLGLMITFTIFFFASVISIPIMSFYYDKPTVEGRKEYEEL